MKNNFKIFVIAVLFVMLISLACGSSTPTASVQKTVEPPNITAPLTNTVVTQPEEPTVELSPTTAPQPEVPVSYLGDPVTKDGFTLTATEVSDPATGGVLYTKKDGYHLVEVKVIVENNSGKDNVTMSPLYFALLDADGFSYSPDIMSCENTDLISTGAGFLKSGEKIRGWVCFEVPDGTKLESIRYTEFLTTTSVEASLVPKP